MANSRIHPIKAGGVEEAARAMGEVGWGNQSRQTSFFEEHPNCVGFVAEDGGSIVGASFGAANGRVGWLGLVFVSPEFRGRGLGESLTRAAMDDLERRGCRSLVLVATGMGRPLYEKLGFEVETEYHGFSGPGCDSKVEGFEVVSSGDMDGVLRLDRRVTGEDRARFLEAMPRGWMFAPTISPRRGAEARPSPRTSRPGRRAWISAVPSPGRKVRRVCGSRMRMSEAQVHERDWLRGIPRLSEDGAGRKYRVGAGGVVGDFQSGEGMRLAPHPASSLLRLRLRYFVRSGKYDSRSVTARSAAARLTTSPIGVDGSGAGGYHHAVCEPEYEEGRMARIDGVEPDRAEKRVRTVLDAQAKKWGKPLLNHLLYARRPSIFSGARAMWGGLGSSGMLDPRLVALINRRVAALNGCVF